MDSTAVATYEPDGAAVAVQTPHVVPTQASTVFSSDAAGADGFGRGEAASLLAEVATHRLAETPIVLALFGPAGAGKSLFLRKILDRVAAISGTGTPDAARILTVVVEATADRDPAATLSHAVLAALDQSYPGLAEEAVYGASDPREAARLAGERANALRGTLDRERQALDGLAARQARLAETVLFDAAGSRVDTYARANRSRIETRLRGFGLPASDPLQTYKQLVAETAEATGSASRSRLVLRSLWGFDGQGRLLLSALLLFGFGWAAAIGAAHVDALSAWLGGTGDRFAALTDWERDHLAWLQPLSQVAVALGALAVLAAVVRAARFLAPVLRGASLLKGDLEARRRDLDGLLAHQTRRVDGLAAEVEAASRNAEASERRIDPRRGAGMSDHGAALAADLFGPGTPRDAAAASFFRTLSSAMEAQSVGPTADVGPGHGSAPARIVVAVDHLDRLPGLAAAAFLDAVHRLLSLRHVVTLVAMERRDMAAALAEADPALAAARLDRMVQLSYDLGAEPLAPAELVERLLDPHPPRPAAPSARSVAPPIDAGRSALDRPLQRFERDLMTDLAPFAGETPRSIKRFVNTYRIARADPRLRQATPGTMGCLAWALALDGTGAGSELSSVEQDAALGRMTMDPKSDVGHARAVVEEVIGKTIDAGEARQGLSVARSYSRHR